MAGCDSNQIRTFCQYLFRNLKKSRTTDYTPVCPALGRGSGPAGRDLELITRITDALNNKERCVESFQTSLLG
jgi:hypothetical protein